MVDRQLWHSMGGGWKEMKYFKICRFPIYTGFWSSHKLIINLVSIQLSFNIQYFRKNICSFLLIFFEWMFQNIPYSNIFIKLNWNSPFFQNLFFAGHTGVLFVDNFDYCKILKLHFSNLKSWICIMKPLEIVCAKFDVSSLSCLERTRTCSELWLYVTRQSTSFLKCKQSCFILLNVVGARCWSNPSWIRIPVWKIWLRWCLC